MPGTVLGQPRCSRKPVASGPGAVRLVAAAEPWAPLLRHPATPSDSQFGCARLGSSEDVSAARGCGEECPAGCPLPIGFPRGTQQSRGRRVHCRDFQAANERRTCGRCEVRGPTYAGKSVAARVAAGPRPKWVEARSIGRSPRCDTAADSSGVFSGDLPTGPARPLRSHRAHSRGRLPALCAKLPPEQLLPCQNRSLTVRGLPDYM